MNVYESIPENRYEYEGKAKEAVERYQKIGEWDREESIEAAESKAAQRVEWDKIAEVANVLASAVNGGSAKKGAQALYIGVSRSHRTLQNQIVHLLVEFLSIYKDTAYDLRNQAAVVAAKQITQKVEEDGLVFPVI